LTNFNVASATFGGFVTVFGLVSYLCKGRFYLSECLISLLAGLLVSPHAANFIRPLDYVAGSQADVEAITLYFSRLVLAVQLVLAGVDLPSRYCLREWRPLALLLGPGMTAMWLFTALATWAMVPGISFLFALAVGACVTPTDPVLSGAIVKGRYADEHVPGDLQQLIIAEAGANDGLGYPFLFLALYLIQYTGMGGAGQTHPSAHKAIGLWFGETWGYTILLSVAYGAVVGYLAKVALRWAETHRYVDRENFLIFAVTLGLFIMGTCGMIGSDDILACFVAGNAFTIDDWFRLETVNDSVQPTIDMLLNLSIFMWYGAICPWAKLANNDILPLWRLVVLGILVLLVRRIPIILAVYRKIPQIRHLGHAAFVGFFGPVGVGAVFYLYLSREYIKNNIRGPDGQVREDAARLADIIEVVIWFVVLCSVIVHGLAVPCLKLGSAVYKAVAGRNGAGGRSAPAEGSDAGAGAGTALPSCLPTLFQKRSSRELPFSEQPTAVADSPAASAFKPAPSPSDPAAPDALELRQMTPRQARRRPSWRNNPRQTATTLCASDEESGVEAPVRTHGVHGGLAADRRSHGNGDVIVGADGDVNGIGARWPDSSVSTLGAARTSGVE
ncbi:hypothetical protein KEM52_000341, partial [Ascosphaera acerosa]